ncbi:hypothetical protein KL946_004099 [Ogataea haglerorum]|uniref:Uncharacterized protein n=1 Tax=Ogataea haglerorum TaxID=1937702 RepID=A0ABQ7RCS5_9ASCO|nr:hypothetical protein KL946_004099 [Ogataea haglerorum]
MALLSPKNRLLFVIGVLLYVVTHITVKCPLSQTYQLDASQSSDALCLYTHKYYRFVEPYCGPVFEVADARVFTPLNNLYAKSPVKPIVQAGYSQSAKVYTKFAKPHVDKYGGVAKTKLGELSKKMTAKAQEVAGLALVYARAKSAEVGEYASAKSLELTTKAKIVVLTKIIPRTVSLFHRMKTELYIQGTKLRLALYLRYNLYVRPQLLKLYYKLRVNKLEPHVEALRNSWFYVNTKRLVVLLVDALRYFYCKTYEYLDAFQRDSKIRKTTEEYWRTEHKKQFLKDEFNKLLNAKFKIPTYEDVEFFKKLSKQAAETDKTDDVSETLSEAEPTLTKYNKLLRGVTQDAINDFESQVAQVDENAYNKIYNQLRPKLQELGELVNRNYDEAHVMIHDINHNTDNYVTRQDMRDLLKRLSESLTQKGVEITEDFKKYEREFSDEVLRVRTSILETLEEFSESTLNAYSTEIVKNGDDWKEWKNYKELKQELIQTRDQLLSSTPKLERVTKLLNELNRTLGTLVNDGESYLAILRAKANVEFQAREKAEREAEQETTSTIMLYETVVLDEKNQPVSTIHAEPPASSEEAKTLII